MKVKIPLFLMTVLPLLIPIANANQENIEPDFLEFLADMEEVTGDGFDNWLKSDSESDFYADTQEHNDNQIESESN